MARWSLSQIRGRRDPWLLFTGLADHRATGFVMKVRVQFVHRANGVPHEAEEQS